MAVEIYGNVLINQQADDLYELCGQRTKLIYGGSLRNNILNYFSLIFDGLNVKLLDVSVRYYHSSRPFAIHSDGLSARGGAIPVNHTLLVPLTWSPIESSTHTVFFDQFDETPGHEKMFYTHSTAKRYVPGGKKIIPTSTDYTRLSDMTGEPFDKEIYDQQLSHIDYDDLHGLSIHRSVKWTIGDAILFESNRLHCSAAFGTDVLSVKSHLLFKFNIPE